jgi:RNA polymerase sigma-70 factor (ECF subfamily)
LAGLDALTLETAEASRAETPRGACRNAPASDAELAEQLRAGEFHVFAQLYDEHHAALHSFAHRLLGDEPAAEDLVQEVFAVLPRLASRFDSGASLRSFLLGIAANRARHHVRSRRRRERLLERLGREPAEAVAAPDHVSQRHSLAAALTRALELLPLDQRVTFVLREIEGYSVKDAAEILRVPESTVRTRVFNARKRLRALLEHEGLP